MNEITDVSDGQNHLSLPNAEVYYFPSFFDKQEADAYFQKLYTETPWQQDDIKVFGKVYAQPRLTALYGDEGKPYAYSNIVMHPHAFTNVLLDVKQQVEAVAKTNFTSVLLNLYRDGKDSNGWHADDEKELGQNPIIASVSFGEERYFHFRSKEDRKSTHKLRLAHGSLLLMKGVTQHHWHHQIPKTAKKVGPRINLTFRVIKS